MKKVLILGGNGYLGQRLCKKGIENGLKITSLSRSGLPKITNGKIEAWMNEVNWQKGDLLNLNSYSHLLSNQDTIIHSVGAIFDFNYKPLVSNEWNKVMKEGIRNGNQVREMNFVSVKNLLEELKKHQNIQSLFYLSATNFLPEILTKDYISSKKASEQRILLDQNTDFVKKFIVQPGLMYSEDRPLAFGLAAGLLLGKQLVCSNIEQPLATDFVTDKIIKVIKNQEKFPQKNIFNINKILEL
ncbi:NAD(P)-binding protein [Neoconidiobolus thromboides FSU 785]|nr:NAD(P)-binding protein [Neoconidiobolus thromboides FSU 785]